MSITADQSLHLNFDIRDRQLRLIGFGRSDTRPPTGEAKPFKPIAATIIGHWVEIQNKQGHTLYRRFLQNLLPLNYLRQEGESAPHRTAEGCQEEAGKISTRKAAKKVTAITKPFEVTVPLLEDGHELFVYEQSIPSPQVKQTRRQLHSRINLSEYLCPEAVPKPSLDQEECYGKGLRMEAVACE